MSADSDYTNHLEGQTSPYLLQHLHNPVDWYPWGEQALEKARTENKPILLSIGYSACHWCHVMAHESFEDPATAEVMNSLFVNIKVDREERPDLDRIYQTAHSLLTQRNGGWPLTMFLTPDGQVPFFGGTYFPRESRHGLPAFSDLCRRVAAFHEEKNADIRRQNESLLNFMNSMGEARETGQHVLDAMPLEVARQQLEQQYDAEHGGFGAAPKFPHPTSLERLLRHWAASGGKDERALEMVLHTLDRMALGGLFDQLGGGFCRYSVDARWMIPHFEKMLYDNGPLLSLYSDALAVTGKDLYRHTIELTADWVMGEMQAPDGGYYSSLDADSEGEEGKFYVWTRQQLRDVLNDNEYAAAAQRWGIDRPANFEGQWHLHTYPDINWDKNPLIESARVKLLAARQARVHPGRDEKTLVSWNALMIKGMARAARVLDNSAYQRSAEQAVRFIAGTLWRDGRLLATSKDGRAHLPAYLDDYAFLIDALLELLQLRWDSGELAFARQLAEVMLRHFRDPAGGFYFTADDHERLIQRPKTLTDDAMPAGNAIAARVLGRLGYLLGEPSYLETAEQTLRGAWSQIQQSPYAHTGLCQALEEYLEPVETIVIRADDKGHWLRECAGHYAPRRQVFSIPADATDLPEALAQHRVEDSTVAYICQGSHCLAPVTTLDALRDYLGNNT